MYLELGLHYYMERPMIIVARCLGSQQRTNVGSVFSGFPMPTQGWPP